MVEISNRWVRTQRRQMSRRWFLTRSATAAGAGAVAFAIACGGDSQSEQDAGGASSASGADAAGTAGASSQAATPKQGGILTASFAGDPTALDPNYSRGSGDTTVLRPFYDTLVSFDAESNVLPMLAESWEQSDSTTWVFHLRSGVQFHDGTPFDAPAAKTFLDAVRDPSLGSTQRSELDPIASIEAPDPRTLTLKLKAPFSPLPAALYGRAGMIVSPTQMQKFGKDTATRPAGTGPFKLAEYSSGAQVRLERFDGYWNPGKTYLDGITFRIFKDTEAAISTFEAGNLDALSTVPASSIDRIAKITKTTIFDLDSSTRNGFLFQVTRPPFNDENLRRAVSAAAGYEDVLAVANRGKGKIRSQNFWYPWGWAFYDDVQPPKKDIALAKSYLAKAGKPDGFEFTVTIINVIPDLDVLRANLAQAGIRMKDEVLETGAYAQRNVEKNWQAQYTLKSPNATMDPGVWAKRFIWTKGAFATSGIEDPEMDAMILKGEQETSVEARTAIYREVNKRWFAQGQNDSPMFLSAFCAFKENVNGFALHPEGNAHMNEAWRA